MRISDESIKEALKTDAELPEEMKLFVSEQLRSDAEQIPVRQAKTAGGIYESREKQHGLVMGLLAIAAVIMLAVTAVKLIPALRPSTEAANPGSTETHHTETLEAEKPLNTDQTPEEEETLNADQTPEEEETLNTDQTPEEEETLNTDQTPEEEETLNTDQTPEEEKTAETWFRNGEYYAEVSPTSSDLIAYKTFADIPIASGKLHWGMSEKEVIAVLGEPDEWAEWNDDIVFIYHQPMETAFGYECTGLRLFINRGTRMTDDEMIVMGLNYISLQFSEAFTSFVEPEKMIREYYGSFDDRDDKEALLQIQLSSEDWLVERYRWYDWSLEKAPELLSKYLERGADLYEYMESLKEKLSGSSKPEADEEISTRKDSYAVDEQASEDSYSGGLISGTDSGSLASGTYSEGLTSNFNSGGLASGTYSEGLTSNFNSEGLASGTYSEGLTSNSSSEGLASGTYSEGLTSNFNSGGLASGIYSGGGTTFEGMYSGEEMLVEIRLAIQNNYSGKRVSKELGSYMTLDARTYLMATAPIVKVDDDAAGNASIDWFSEEGMGRTAETMPATESIPASDLPAATQPAEATETALP